MGVILYEYLPSPPCRSVKLLARELGVELELKTVNIFQKEHLKPEFIALNPEHSLPTLEDDGFVVWDSTVILQYLANKYGKEDDPLYPRDPQKRAVVDQRLVFSQAKFFRAFLDYVVPVVFEGQDHFCAKKKAKLDDVLALLDLYIDKSGGWVAGSNRTIADYGVVAIFTNFLQLDSRHEIDVSKYKNVLQWWEKCKTEMKDYDELVKVSADTWGTFFNEKTKAVEIK